MWDHGGVWSPRLVVSQEIAGSNPAGPVVVLVGKWSKPLGCGPSDRRFESDLAPWMSGHSAVWEHACLGSRKSAVQIRLSR